MHIAGGLETETGVSISDDIPQLRKLLVSVGLCEPELFMEGLP